MGGIWREYEIGKELNMAVIFQITEEDLQRFARKQLGRNLTEEEIKYVSRSLNEELTSAFELRAGRAMEFMDVLDGRKRRRKLSMCI